MPTAANGMNISSAGLVNFDGTNVFSGVTTTQYNALVGSTANGITNVIPTATSGVPLISQGSSANPIFGTAVVAGGGTGATTLTGLVLGNGTSAMTTISYTAAGSWTPGIAFGGGTTGITYSSQVGKYTQIGNIVFFSCIVTLSSKGSSTGAATITGLPVTIGGGSCKLDISSAQNVTFTASYITAYWATVNATTTFNVNQYSSTLGVASLTDTNFANNTNLQFSGFYFTS